MSGVLFESDGAKPAETKAHRDWFRVLGSGFVSKATTSRFGEKGPDRL